MPSKWPRHKLLDVYLRASPKVSDEEFRAMTTCEDQLNVLRSFPGWAKFHKNGEIRNEGRKTMSALLTFLFLGVDASMVRSKHCHETIVVMVVWSAS